MHTHPEEPMLPDQFAALEPFAKRWCLEKEVDRYQERLDSTMIELQALYEAGMRYGEAAQAHLDQFDLYNLPHKEQHLLWLMMSVIIVSFPCEAFRQPRVPDTGATYLSKTIDPGP